MTADMINHPPHYTSSPARCTCGRPIECIDVTRHMGFNLGNAVKYLWRADLKGAALDDLRKAVWYIQDEIAKREGANRLPDEGTSVADHIARRQAGLDAIIREAEAAGLYDIAPNAPAAPRSAPENGINASGLGGVAETATGTLQAEATPCDTCRHFVPFAANGGWSCSIPNGGPGQAFRSKGCKHHSALQARKTTCATCVHFANPTRVSGGRGACLCPASGVSIAHASAEGCEQHKALGAQARKTGGEA